MNPESGSALQKVSFVLVLFIAAAAGYLVVRERIRADQQRAAEEAAVAAAAAANTPPAGTAPERVTPTGEKPSFAPLRPRVENNVVQAVSNRFIGVPGPASNRIVVVGQTASGVPTRVTPEVVVEAPVVVAGGGGVRGDGRSVTGRVLLRGIPPPETAITLDAVCAALQPAPITTRHYVVGEGGALADVFVYIQTGASPAVAPAGGVTPLLDQINCQYQPYVLGVQAGQPFNVRNSDPMGHNVHTLPKVKGNPERNVGQGSKGITTQFAFEKSEVFVQFKCDVHPWMFAYVGVVDHPWFAVTDKQGSFTLPPGLPPGQYRLAAVHRKAGEQIQRVNISTEDLRPVTFTFDVPRQ